MQNRKENQNNSEIINCIFSTPNAPTSNPSGHHPKRGKNTPETGAVFFVQNEMFEQNNFQNVLKNIHFATEFQRFSTKFSFFSTNRKHVNRLN